jgi:Holliday junction DNA helicase RuvA
LIGRLKGTIEDLKPTELILDVGGVGYLVQIPFSTYEKLTGEAAASLFIYTYHREDSLRLYGFYTMAEKSVFSILLGISGIGPSMALSVISGISIEALIDSVKNENPSYLTGIPGIGKSRAEKLIFELKRKIKKIETLSAGQAQPASSGNLAVEALVTLGFDEARSLKTIEALIKEKPDSTAESLIKEALRSFASR